MSEGSLTYYNITSAIEKLPRSLATIGESIMEQTRWHISILAGGPSPENGGAMVTYL